LRAPAENIIEIELVKGNKGRKRAVKHGLFICFVCTTFVSFEKEKLFVCLMVFNANFNNISVIS
jgi:hypothetical protein